LAAKERSERSHFSPNLSHQIANSCFRGTARAGEVAGEDAPPEDGGIFVCKRRGQTGGGHEEESRELISKNFDSVALLFFFFVFSFPPSPSINLVSFFSSVAVVSPFFSHWIAHPLSPEFPDFLIANRTRLKRETV